MKDALRKLQISDYYETELREMQRCREMEKMLARHGWIAATSVLLFIVLVDWILRW